MIQCCSMYVVQTCFLGKHMGDWSRDGRYCKCLQQMYPLASYTPAEKGNNWKEPGVLAMVLSFMHVIEDF